MTVLIVIITALITSSTKEGKRVESPKEVVYVTSLPTVEVQGVYISNKEVKQ